MLKEESGLLGLFGADWEAVVTAEYEPDDPDCGIAGGFTVVRIELRGYYDRGVLIKFRAPAVVDLSTVSHSELDDIAAGFDADRLDDDFDIDGKRWVL